MYVSIHFPFNSYPELFELRSTATAIKTPFIVHKTFLHFLLLRVISFLIKDEKIPNLLCLCFLG